MLSPLKLTELLRLCYPLNFESPRISRPTVGWAKMSTHGYATERRPKTGSPDPPQLPWFGAATAVRLHDVRRRLLDQGVLYSLATGVSVYDWMESPKGGGLMRVHQIRQQASVPRT